MSRTRRWREPGAGKAQADGGGMVWLTPMFSARNRQNLKGNLGYYPCHHKN